MRLFLWLLVYYSFRIIRFSGFYLFERFERSKKQKGWTLGWTLGWTFSGKEKRNVPLGWTFGWTKYTVFFK